MTSAMMNMLADLTPLNRVMCSTDFDYTIDYLSRMLPMSTTEYRAGEERNGWVIPPRWDVLEATIHRDGTLVYDGKAHPLGVIALSAPFEGRVSSEELRKHLHYDHRYDDSLTFHFRQQFRTWERDWGFCVSRRLYDSLTPGDYDVRIVTSESPGYLKVLTADQPGRIPYTIAMCANVDHPGVANDGLAGVAVGIEVMRRLQGRPTKYRYRLVLAAGIMGTEYYLGGLSSDERSRILECLCLWMLGSRTQLSLQESRQGLSNLEHALAGALDSQALPYRRGEFESIIINDEYLWEGYGIPTCSLSRFPYPEYHSSRDDISIMSERSLEEAVSIVLRAIDGLERSPLVEKRFQGTVCLSNPRYDLYIDPGQISFGENITAERRRLRELQDFLPSLTTPVTVRRLASRFDLPEESVLAYLEKWQRKGLLALW